MIFRGTSNKLSIVQVLPDLIAADWDKFLITNVCAKFFLSEDTSR